MENPHMMQTDFGAAVYPNDPDLAENFQLGFNVGVPLGVVGGLAAGGAKSGEAKAPYADIENPRNVGPGKDFTQAQKQKILEANRAKNEGVLRSDQSGAKLVASQQSKKGVTPPQNAAQVDHIKSKAKGGTNESSNAQVLSREENIKKSDN
jgi:hypothetical protein